MDAELKQKWLDALRSGEYKQGKDQLRSSWDDPAYCCLGVLRDISGRGRWVADKFVGRGESLFYGSERSDGDGRNEGRYLLGMRYGIGDKVMGDLMTMNDEGLDFNAIADHIEKNVRVKGERVRSATQNAA